MLLPVCVMLPLRMLYDAEDHENREQITLLPECAKLTSHRTICEFSLTDDEARFAPSTICENVPA